MALLLRVLLLGALAAAADDVPVTWFAAAASLACVVPGARRQPPPLDGGEPRRPKAYNWTRAGLEVARASTLEVTRREDEGLYQCSTKQQNGSVLGYPINLKFAYIGSTASVHPEVATTKVGWPYVLTCEVSSAPEPTVTWSKDGEVLGEDSSHFFVRNQLLFTSVEAGDAGYYRCTATNPYLNTTSHSHRRRLVIGEGSGGVALHHQGNLVVERNSRVVLPCPTMGKANTEMIWEQTPPGDRTAELEETRSVLVLNSIQDDQEGVYSCREAGAYVPLKTFTVTISQPVKITLPPVSRSVVGAATVRFNCTAEGKPAPNVTWYKDGKELALVERRSIQKANNDDQRLELVISGVTSEDAGVYQCMAHNGRSIASAWAHLTVTATGAPTATDLHCQPTGARSVRLNWSLANDSNLVAFTIHIIGTNSTEDTLSKDKEADRELKEPLTPYELQVRVYKNKVVSDMSKTVTCQGQGIPITVTKVSEEQSSISWEDFAARHPGVVEWKVQYSNFSGGNVPDVEEEIMGADVHETKVDPSRARYVRVLGTRAASWPAQDLTLVPWMSTSGDADIGSEPVPQPADITATEASDGFTLRWRCVRAPCDKHSFVVCARERDHVDEDCRATDKNEITFNKLEPDTEYEVQVQTMGQPMSDPIIVRTEAAVTNGPQLSYQFVGTNTVQISWDDFSQDVPPVYILQYTTNLAEPIDEWTSVKVNGLSAKLKIDPTERIYVRVASQDLAVSSNMKTIPSQLNPRPDLIPRADLPVEASKLGSIVPSYSGDRVTLSWESLVAGPVDRYRVQYTQNLTAPIEQWLDVTVKQPRVELVGLEPALATYVRISPPGWQVFTVPPFPDPEFSYLYLGIGLCVGFLLLILLLVAALFIWRRRKRMRSPIRARRRPSNDCDEEEGSDMKSIGGRLANGGVTRGAGAGEPLLNGHVHITENPTISKIQATPNGQTRKSRREQTTDLSRYDDADTTQETDIDADTSTSTHFNLLDASRREYHSDVSTNNSFSKLPDDNMNSELTRSTDYLQKDSSNIHPTLQPNG